MGSRLHPEFSVWSDRYVKNKCWCYSHLSPSDRMELHLFSRLSISMESKCNTNCQITASIMKSYTSVLTLN